MGCVAQSLASQRLCGFFSRERAAEFEKPELCATLLYIMLRDGIDYAEFVRRGSHAGMLGDVALV